MGHLHCFQGKHNRQTRPAGTLRKDKRLHLEDRAPALLPQEACAFNLRTKAICLVHNGKAFDELDRVPFTSLSWLRNVAKMAEIVLAFKEACSKSAHQATKVMTSRVHSDQQLEGAPLYKQAVLLPSLTRFCEEAVWLPSLEVEVGKQLSAECCTQASYRTLSRSSSAEQCRL